MRITKIEEYKNNRMKITIDDDMVFALYKGEVKKYHLEQDGEISKENYCSITELLYGRARERALYLLDDSYKTEKQIRDKLKNGCYPDVVIERVIANLKEYDLINDLRYAQLYIEYKAESKSKRQMVQDLYVKGIATGIIDQAFEMSEYSDELSLAKLIEKRKAKYDLRDQKDVQKLYRYLMGKGYKYNDVKTALSGHMDLY